MIRIVKWVLAGAAALVAVVVAVALAGSLLSLDWGRSHRTATQSLPTFSGFGEGPASLVRIPANGMEFRARIAGSRGDGVILLHGFPETSAMWIPLIELLSDQGFRVVAFDQRGYSPGARPEALDAYSIPQLVDDVFAVAEATGMQQFHLVGHDWGAAVGWAAVMARPERLRSWTSLSIPHIAAFGDALANDADQQQRSRYMQFFRMPLLPETAFTFNRLKLMDEAMYGEMSETQRAEYHAVFSEPGALTAALNWYRAPAGFNVAPAPKVRLPILFIWGNHDPAVSRYAVESQRNFIEGQFDYHELNAGHWLMEEATDKVDSEILLFLRAVDAKTEVP